MPMSTLIVVLILIVIALVVLFFVFYKRAGKETAFVRTGLWGEKVVKTGGAIVIPRLHEI